jgi:hypothetical protein
MLYSEILCYWFGWFMIVFFRLAKNCILIIEFAAILELNILIFWLRFRLRGQKVDLVFDSYIKIRQIQWARIYFSLKIQYFNQNFIKTLKFICSHQFFQFTIIHIIFVSALSFWSLCKKHLEKCEFSSFPQFFLNIIYFHPRFSHVFLLLFS